MNKLYIITGPAGVGKSTVSKALANKIDKSVLIEGDDIYNQFVGGRISPWKENAPINLFYDNCFLLIENYLKNGYDVVFNYIIKKETLKEIKNKFKDYDLTFTVLLTNKENLIKRDLERPIDCQMGERSLVLLNEFINEKYEEKHILNTENINIDEEVEMILKEERFKLRRD